MFPKVGGSWGREQVRARTSAYLGQRAIELGRHQISRVGQSGTLELRPALCHSILFPLSLSLLRKHNMAQRIQPLEFALGLSSGYYDTMWLPISFQFKVLALVKKALYDLAFTSLATSLTPLLLALLQSHWPSHCSSFTRSTLPWGFTSYSVRKLPHAPPQKKHKQASCFPMSLYGLIFHFLSISSLCHLLREIFSDHTALWKLVYSPHPVFPALT